MQRPWSLIRRTGSSGPALLFAVLLFGLSAPASAQVRPLLTPADYGRWESLGEVGISPDGRWLAYEVERVEEDGDLRIRRIDGDETSVVPLGDRPAFAADGRWLAYGIGVSESESGGDESEMTRRTAVLVELQSGGERHFDNVARFEFDPDAHALVLVSRGPETADDDPDEDSGPRRGSDVRVVDLDTGSVTAFGNVAEFAWSDSGSLLALRLVTGEAAGNGVQLWNARSGVLRSLDSSPSAYSGLEWREDAFDLAVLKSVEPGDEEGPQEVLAWLGLNGGAAVRRVLGASTAGIPEGHSVVGTRGPQWVARGSIVAVGMRQTDTSEDDGESEENADGDAKPEPADVQIWHSKDVYIYPQQQSRLEADRQRTLLAAWHLEDDRIVQLSDDLATDAVLAENGRYAINRDASPYDWGTMFGRRYHDAYRVDARTGERSLIEDRVRYSYLSAGGRYLLIFDGTDYSSIDLATDEERNLTAGLAATFANIEYDTPTDVIPPFGVSGWTDGDDSVLLRDEFDLWRVSLDGSGAERLTRGAEDEVVHRLVRFGGPDEPIDLERPVYLSLRGRWTKEEGYARLENGRSERLVLESRGVRSLQKADSTDVLLVQLQAADDSPDIFVGDSELSHLRQLSQTNPFQNDFAWPHSELIDYESEAGIRLQGALRYPANYDSGRRYPMIVYTYEIVSTRLHDYTIPSVRRYYNDMVWQQAGYFVLRADIVFRARDPGVSTLEAVRPAVAEVVGMGLVDPDRVGLIGHSWGGYEAVFVPTRTNTFAATVSGAPLTDFVSMMGAIHWNSGLPEVGHWETGQARMEVPFWEDPEAHRRNSPVHKVHELETPILMAFGDADGTVDYDQGTEFFNFARRAGKQFVLLIYEGENHGFRARKNQSDYQIRILEWFGHYLKGEPAPEWITDGIRVADQDAERKRIARKPPGGP